MVRQHQARNALLEPTDTATDTYTVSQPTVDFGLRVPERSTPAVGQRAHVSVRHLLAMGARRKLCSDGSIPSAPIEPDSHSGLDRSVQVYYPNGYSVTPRWGMLGILTPTGNVAQSGKATLGKQVRVLLKQQRLPRDHGGSNPPVPTSAHDVPNGPSRDRNRDVCDADS